MKLVQFITQLLISYLIQQKIYIDLRQPQIPLPTVHFYFSLQYWSIDIYIILIVFFFEANYFYVVKNYLYAKKYICKVIIINITYMYINYWYYLIDFQNL